MFDCFEKWRENCSYKIEGKFMGKNGKLKQKMKNEKNKNVKQKWEERIFDLFLFRVRDCIEHFGRIFWGQFYLGEFPIIERKWL